MTLGQQPRVVYACGIGAILLLSALAWLVAFRPSINSRAAYRHLVAERQAERKALMDAEAEAQGATARLTALRLSLEEHPLILQNQNELSKKLQQITELSNKTGLQLGSLEAGKSESYSRHGTVGIQLTARCSVSSLWEFFHGLHAQMPDIAVQSIDLTGRYVNKESTPGLTMTLVWQTAPLDQVALP